MNTPNPDYARPSARWVVLVTCAIVILPVVFLEWEREPARWIAAGAQELAQNRQFVEAQEKLDEAIRRYPASTSLLWQRIELNLQWVKSSQPWRHLPAEAPPTADQRDALLQQALADIQRLTEQNAHPVYRRKYCEILLQLQDGLGAVAQWKLIAENPQGLRPEMLLNEFAYTRACANLELPEALEQVNEALGYRPKPSPSRTAFLDTRGVIHHLMGNHDAALEDMNAAIEAFRDQEFSKWDKNEAAKQASDMRIVEELDLQAREGMATLLYHRYLVLDAMGDPGASQEDYDQILELLPGYDDQVLR